MKTIKEINNLKIALVYDDKVCDGTALGVNVVINQKRIDTLIACEQRRVQPDIEPLEHAVARALRHAADWLDNPMRGIVSLRESRRRSVTKN